jgi:S1-C subfamily serine protease
MRLLLAGLLVGPAAAHTDDTPADTVAAFVHMDGPARREALLQALRDLALLGIDGFALPHAELAPAAPRVGDPVVVIGHPGRGAEPPFQVTWGHIRAFRLLRDGDQSLGAVSHDAPTDWGHSGSPLFDAAGHIVALHNSWDPATAMRHAIPWEAITAFLDATRPSPGRTPASPSPALHPGE